MIDFEKNFHYYLNQATKKKKKIVKNYYIKKLFH